MTEGPQDGGRLCVLAIQKTSRILDHHGYLPLVQVPHIFELTASLFDSQGQRVPQRLDLVSHPHTDELAHQAVQAGQPGGLRVGINVRHLQQTQADEAVHEAEPGIVVAGFRALAELWVIARDEAADPGQRYRVRWQQSSIVEDQGFLGTEPAQGGAEGKADELLVMGHGALGGSSDSLDTGQAFLLQSAEQAGAAPLLTCALA